MSLDTLTHESKTLQLVAALGLASLIFSLIAVITAVKLVTEEPEDLKARLACLELDGGNDCGVDGADTQRLREAR